METGEELTVTERILPHAKAVVLAIEPLETIDPTRPIGRVITQFLLEEYRRRLRAIVASVPMWMTEQILSASQHIDEGRPAVWLTGS